MDCIDFITQVRGQFLGYGMVTDQVMLNKPKF